MVAIRGGIGWLLISYNSGWRYTKLSLSSALLLFFSDMGFVLLLLCLCRFLFCFVFDVMLSLELCRCSSDIFSLADRIGNHVILLGMVEARSVSVKNTHTHAHTACSK